MSDLESLASPPPATPASLDATRAADTTVDEHADISLPTTPTGDTRAPKRRKTADSESDNTGPQHYCPRCSCHRCKHHRSEYDDGSGEYEPITQRAVNFNASPMVNVKKGSSMDPRRKIDASDKMAGAISEATMAHLNITPDAEGRRKFCAITLSSEQSDCLEYGHVLRRSTPADEIAKLEEAWGYESKTLHVDTSNNLVTLTPSMHRAFDANHWALVPTDKGLVQKIEDYNPPLDREGNESTIKTLYGDQTKFEYSLVPFDTFKSIFIRREDDKNPESRHSHPYPDFPSIFLHVHPHLIIFNLGQKLEKHGLTERPLWEWGGKHDTQHKNLGILKRCDNIYRKWCATNVASISLPAEPVNKSDKDDERDSRRGNRRGGGGGSKRDGRGDGAGSGAGGHHRSATGGSNASKKRKYGAGGTSGKGDYRAGTTVNCAVVCSSGATTVVSTDHDASFKSCAQDITIADAKRHDQATFDELNRNGSAVGAEIRGQVPSLVINFDVNLEDVRIAPDESRQWVRERILELLQEYRQSSTGCDFLNEASRIPYDRGKSSDDATGGGKWNVTGPRDDHLTLEEFQTAVDIETKILGLQRSFVKKF